MGIPRSIAKRIAFAALGNGPLLRRRLEQLRRSGVATILNLHRVGTGQDRLYPPLDPGLFEDLLDYLEREFEIRTLATLSEPATRPRIVLSFDDGYQDFVSEVMPRLEKRRIKVNQNIIPACVESGLPPLNVLAQQFVEQAPAELSARLEVPGFEGLRDASFGTRLSSFIKNKPFAEQQSLADRLMPQFMAWDEFRPIPMMNGDELRQAAATHEIGAHSYSHASMGEETDEFFIEDLRRCDDYFRDQLGSPVRIYAFPNGSYRAEQVSLARNYGIEHVLLVDETFDTDRQAHARFTFDARSPSEMRFKALGGLARVPE